MTLKTAEDVIGALLGLAILATVHRWSVEEVRRRDPWGSYAELVAAEGPYMPEPAAEPEQLLAGFAAVLEPHA